MNEELIKQCAREANDIVGRHPESASQDAIRLYHARTVQPLIEAARQAQKMLDELTMTEDDDWFYSAVRDAWCRAVDVELVVRQALAAFEPVEDE